MCIIASTFPPPPRRWPGGLPQPGPDYPSFCGAILIHRRGKLLQANRVWHYLLIPPVSMHGLVV